MKFLLKTKRATKIKHVLFRNKTTLWRSNPILTYTSVTFVALKRKIELHRSKLCIIIMQNVCICLEDENCIDDLLATR